MYEQDLPRLHHGQSQAWRDLYRRHGQPRRSCLAAQEPLFNGSFTDRYDCDRLVWYEVHEDVTAAIEREKRIKDWQRAWKERLIEAMNPDWRDLSADVGL
jgi:putative endonuclease